MIWFNVSYDDADLYTLKIKIKGKIFEYPYKITKEECLDVILGSEEDEP